MKTLERHGRRVLLFFEDIGFSIVQLGCAGVFNIFLKLYFPITVYRPKRFTVPAGTVFLVNHQSKLDPFIVEFDAGIRNWLRILPARGPISSEYLQRPIVGKLLPLMGVYDVGETSLERAKKLLFTKELLERKRTVFLFPEGQIVRDELSTQEFQRGAHMLLSQNCPVVFVRLIGFNKVSFRHPRAVNLHIHYSPVLQSTDTEYKVKTMEEFFQTEDPCI